jgi:hypothetical protein
MKSKKPERAQTPSNASDLLELWESVYEDATQKCSAEVSDLRDLETVRSRVKDEGLSFLTIVLPQFAKDFERSLAIGRIDSKCFRNFKKLLPHQAIPAFLQGMLSRIFNQETGGLVNDSPDSPTLVEAVRQVCLLFKKVELPCSPERTKKAIRNFVFVEHELHQFSAPVDAVDSFRAVSEVLWRNLLLGDLLPSLLDPKHGPGATAERILGNQKYVWQRWHERLEGVMPFIGSAYSLGVVAEPSLIQKVTFVPEDDEQPVRVVTVPKTLKAPRIIAVEPVCMQYTQQALQSQLYDAIESYWLTKGHVNFRDQSVNQRLAVRSSATGQLATIDLSDASDRVPLSLVLVMLDSAPVIRDAILACRSNRAELPDGRVLTLRKFASMGSALCFPIEAMYFYTVMVLALLRLHDLPATPSNCRKVSRELYVYGDDLIVPTYAADAVLDCLQEYNCKVNDSKTFLSGKFRESCGIDAYNGYIVTPTYIRSMPPKNRQQASELISWIATANAFYQKGFWRTATLMFSKCERILGELPYVTPESPALGRISFLGYRSASGWSVDHQGLRVKAWVPAPVYRSDKVDGYSALCKSLRQLEKSENSNLPDDELLWGALRKWDSDIPPPRDKHHLERSARRGAVTLKRRWVPVT